MIWLDPLHNMYPDDRFGGLRKVKPASNCCKDREWIKGDKLWVAQYNSKDENGEYIPLGIGKFDLVIYNVKVIFFHTIILI